MSSKTKLDFNAAVTFKIETAMTVFLKALVDKEDEKKKLEDKLTSEENQIKEAID